MDVNANAFRIVQRLTSEDKAAAETVVGRAGGLKGGPARAAALSPDRRKQIARNAIAARWKKLSI
jgi:hypothetical protein